jgi:hypothetical protein
MRATASGAGPGRWAGAGVRMRLGASARRGSRRVRALAPGERGSWAGVGVAASAAQERALERRNSGDAGSEAARGETKRWLATRHAQEELWWKASARDAGTR